MSSAPAGRRSVADRTKNLGVGDAAPDFELKAHTGETWRLSDHIGTRNVVIAFYPFAFTGT
jgi:peroxiredoxin